MIRKRRMSIRCWTWANRNHRDDDRWIKWLIIMQNTLDSITIFGHIELARIFFYYRKFHATCSGSVFLVFFLFSLWTDGEKRIFYCFFWLSPVFCNVNKLTRQLTKFSNAEGNMSKSPVNIEITIALIDSQCKSSYLKRNKDRTQ